MGTAWDGTGKRKKEGRRREQWKDVTLNGEVSIIDSGLIVVQRDLTAVGPTGGGRYVPQDQVSLVRLDSLCVGVLFFFVSLYNKICNLFDVNREECRGESKRNQ